MKRREEEEEERFGRGAIMHARSVPGDDGRQKKTFCCFVVGVAAVIDKRKELLLLVSGLGWSG